MNRLRQEKIKADTMRRVAGPQEETYWLGYRIGLTARLPEGEHEAMLGGVGSPDPMRDARARGYRDGLTFREGEEGKR